MFRRFSVASLALLGLLLSAPISTAFAEDGAKRPSTGKKQPQGKKGKKGKKGKGKNGKKGKKKKNDGVGPFAKKKYPIQERLRPLVLPDGMGEVGLDAGYARVADTDILALAPSFSYGVADVVDFGVTTSLLLAPEADWGRNLGLQAHYLAYDSKELDFAPGLLLPISFVDGAPFTLTLDLPTRYVLNEVVFFYFGQGAVPMVLSPDFALSVVGNGGAGFQVDKGLVLFADTSVLTLMLAPDTDITGIWDMLVLNGGVQYSWDRYWDVGARIGLVNIWEVDDSLTATFNVYGRFRF